MDIEKNASAPAATPDLVPAQDSAETLKSAATPAESSKAAEPQPAHKADSAAMASAAPEVRVQAPAADATKAEAVAPRTTVWRPNRFALLAATIALSAGIGSIVGAAGYSGAAHMMTPAPRAPEPQIVRVDNSAEIKTLRETTAQLRAGFKQLSDNVNALKASLDGGKGGGLAKINETVNRLSENIERQERAHAETAQRIAKTADALDKLEKRAAAMTGAPEVTGSVSASSASKGRGAEAKPPAPPPGPPIVEGWNLRRVLGGDLAIVEGPDRVIEIEVGDTIRGVGRVHDIKKMDGRWAVVTARGLIVSR
jgi:methyl-accepting chemotaxis protein